MFPDTGNGNGSEASTSTDALSPRCCQFKFDEILLATDNFNESLVVGKGGFGKVYKANIRIGTTHVDVAIKRLDLMSNQGAKEFWAEVEMLSKLRHAHLVSLIGYSNYEKEMILVYEYMPHGTLANHLHKLHTPLSWLERLKICIGAARGLDYLHTCTGIDVGVIHRDVKSSNILLHESWAAKISDFGLARIVPTNQSSTHVNTLVKGTFGYIDPNYFATGKLTRKSDVYAFGVVLFEVLCQKRPLDESFECGLATWIQESIKEGNLKQIVYSGIRSEISPKCLKGFARIAKRCLDNHPNQRPTMTEVVFNLESLLSSQQKTNNSLQTPGIPISRGENSVEADDNSEDDDVDEDVDTPLPTVKDLQIWGEAFPGHEIVAAGYSINGTTRCVFKWVRHLRDGSVNCIQYATNPAYTVSADDVGNHLAVEVQPLDDRQRKGKLVTCFANELKEITCHPNMVHVIEKTLSVGHVSFQLMAWNRSLDTWEPAILEIKKSSYSIKLYGSNNSVVIVDSKYTPTMLISLEADIPFQFSILGPGGVEHFLCADFNSTDISCSRDTIVLTMRLFVRRATLGRRKGGLCFS